MQLTSTLQGIRNPGRIIDKNNPKELLIINIDNIFKIIFESINNLFLLFIQEKELKIRHINLIIPIGSHNSESSPKPEKDEIEEKDENPAKKALFKEEEEWRSNFRHICKLHSDLYDCLDALQNNKTVLNILPEATKQQIIIILQRYDVLTSHFYRTTDIDLPILRYRDFGFLPAEPALYDTWVRALITTTQQKGVGAGGVGGGAQPILRFSNEQSTSTLATTTTQNNSTTQNTTLNNLEKYMHDLLPTLLPPSSFAEERSRVCKRIELALIDRQAVPIGSTLHVYGSSANNFGSVGADLDMCIQVTILSYIHI